MISVAFILSPDPYKIVKKGSKADNGGIWIFYAPVFQPGKKVFLYIRITWVHRHQMFFIPVIGNMVVHIDFFPDPVSQEIDGIIMVFLCSLNGHSAGCFIKLPLFSGNLCIICTIKHLPVFNRCFRSVYQKLFLKIII